MRRKRYKVMEHKMLSIGRKRAHYTAGISRRFVTGQIDYSPMMAAFEIERAANSKINESIEKISKEYAGTKA